MKSVWSASIALMSGITVAGSEPQFGPVDDRPLVRLAGNTSSSSDASQYSGSYVHSQNRLPETGHNDRRQVIRGSAPVENYAPDRRRRPNAVYEHFRDGD